MMRKNIVLAAIVLFVLFGCPQTEVPANNTSADGYPVITPVGPPANISEPVNETLPPGYTVNLGDVVQVYYTLWVDGTVYDTNNETLAQEAGIYNPARAYAPFRYTVEFNKGVIDGFIINTVGMAVNETLLFHVDPERGYGPYDPSEVVVVPRYYNKSSYEVVPLSYLESQGLTNISNGTGFSTPYGDVFVDEMDEENVTLFYILIPGHTFALNGIPQQIASYDSDTFTATIEFMLDENQTYQLPNPVTGAPTVFQVTGKTDQNITLDANHPLANETLTFQVTLVDVEPYKG